jgi:hypothetical protein
MKQRIAIYILLIIGGYSCKTNNNEIAKEPSADIKPNEAINKVDKPFKLIDFYRKNKYDTDSIITDTTEIWGYRLIINSIDSLEYFTTLANYYQDINIPGIEMYIPHDKDFEMQLIWHNSNIDYKDSSYYLHINDSILEIPKFVPGRCDGMTFTAIKTLMGIVPEINSFVFWSEGFEGGGYTLVNQKTGKRMAIAGFPKYSPNRKMILASYYDVEVGFYQNEIGFYTYQNDSITKFLRWAEDHYGPEGTIWKNDSLIYFIRISCDDLNSYMYKRTFQSLKFEKKPTANKHNGL